MTYGRLDIFVERDYYPLEIRVRWYKIEDGYLILVAGKLRITVCVGGSDYESNQAAIRASTSSES